MSRGRRVGGRGLEFTVVLLVASLALGVMLVHDRINHSPSRAIVANRATDFVAFYCAGEAVATHRDPYRIEPLRTCEHRFAKDPAKPDWLATPVPFPGYAIAIFAVLAKLPYAVARAIWIFVDLVASGIIVWALWKLTRYPPLVLAAIVGPTLAFGNTLAGESTPIVIAALAVAAYATSRGKLVLAGAVAPVALLEPHVALPSLVALALFERPTLGPIAIGCALAGAISLATTGLAANLAYFTHVLPLQALAEVDFHRQYSATHLVRHFGVAVGPALAIGTLSYVALSALAIYGALRLARATGNGAYVVLLPIVGAVFGGSYVHYVQLVGAIPAAVLLSGQVSLPTRVRVAALALVGVPWTNVAVAKFDIAVIVGSALALGWIAAHAVASETRARRIAWTATTAGVLVLFVALHSRLVPPKPATILGAIPVSQRSGHDFASLSWADYVNHGPVWLRVNPQFEVQQIPTFVGLVMLVGIAFAPRRSRGFDRAAVRP